MAKLNTSRKPVVDYTYEGAPLTYTPTARQQLMRSVMSCLLWENEFYEDGESIAKRISNLIPMVSPEDVAAIAVEARNRMNLRHVPLLLVREMARHKSHRKVVRQTLNQVIQRADELTEFLAIYWKDGKQPIAKSVQRGLADAFPKFNAYQLAKYNQDGHIKLKDVLFLSHAKPTSNEQALVWKKLIDGTLESPDTWEVKLSGGADKRETFERLIKEKKLGALALLRNLRNMIQSGVDDDLIKQAIITADVERVLPFRFIAAAKYAPRFEPELEKAMFSCLKEMPKLPGKTALIIDTGPSMWMAKISSKSEMDRFEAAAALAILAREVCENVRIWAFNDKAYEIPARHGFALRDALARTKGSYSRGGLAVQAANAEGYDRIVVLTDGEWHPISGTGWMKDAKAASPPPIGKHAYMLNVASYKNGIGYGPWTQINGWSDRVIDYITLLEGGK